MNSGAASMPSKRVRNAGKKGHSGYPRRWHVYRVRFDPAEGHEIRKTRPAVIVSNNTMNEMSRTVLVMPITSGRHEYFFRVAIHPPEGGVTKDSVIATEQIRAIDKRRIGPSMGKVNSDTAYTIEQAIRDHFGLPESNILP